MVSSAGWRCITLFAALLLPAACSTYGSLELAASEEGGSGGGAGVSGAGSSAGAAAGQGGAGGGGGRGGTAQGGAQGGTAQGGSAVAGAGGGSVLDAGAGGGSGSEMLKPTGLSPSGTAVDVVREVGTNGDLYEESCPDGQVLIGFHGSIDAPGGDQYLRGAQGICGTLAVSESAPYVVTVSEAGTLPVHGLEAPQAQMAVCPPNQVMTGFAGRSGLWMDSVDVRCAPLTILGQSPTFLLVVGTPSKAGTIGGTGGSPFDPLECAAGDVAVGQLIRPIYSGDVLGTFGVQCATLVLDVEPG